MDGKVGGGEAEVSLCCAAQRPCGWVGLSRLSAECRERVSEHPQHSGTRVCRVGLHAELSGGWGCGGGVFRLPV